MAVGGTPATNVGFYLQNSALASVAQYGVYSGVVGTTAGTTALIAIQSQPATAASAYTVGDVMGFRAFNATKGAGSTITNQYGISISDQTQGTNNYGIASLVTSGTNKYNIYASGTAQNYFAGNVGIGTTSPTTSLQINKNSTSGAAGGLLVKTADSNESLLSVGVSTSLGRAFIASLANGTGTELPLDFITGGTSTNVRMRITSAGSVGIGTTSPTNPLSVTGNANFSGVVGIGGVTASLTGLYITNTALTGTGQFGIFSTPTGTSAATAIIAAYSATPGTAASAFTSTDVIGFRAANAVRGAGSTITNAHGLYVIDQTNGTNNYGITSLVSSGTNKFNVYASGTAQNYFAGNVGIGTASPTSKLVVSNSSNGTTVDVAVANTYYLAGSIDESVTFQGEFYQNDVAANRAAGYMRVTKTGDFSNNANASANLIFATRNAGSITEKMRIDNAGNVGIGTSAPSALLDVSGAPAGSLSRFLNTTAPTLSNDTHAGEALFLRSGGTAASGNVQAVLAFGKADGSSIRSGSAIASVQTTADADQVGIGFYTSISTSSSQTLTQAMLIDASGNVGIGTSSPATKLDVNGRGRFVQDAAATTGAIALRQNSGDTEGAFIQWTTNNAASEKGWLQVDTSSNMKFATVSSERCRIDSSGNFLVGLTSATGVAKLQVSGAISTTGFTVATLPAGTVGMRTYVTDALAPSFSATVVGGGAVTIPVFYNGTNWIVA